MGLYHPIDHPRGAWEQVEIERERERAIQRVLDEALGRFLAGKRDFLALALGEAVSAVRLDGARGIFAGRGREGGGGAEGGELGRWPHCSIDRLHQLPNQVHAKAERKELGGLGKSTSFSVNLPRRASEAPVLAEQSIL